MKKRNRKVSLLSFTARDSWKKKYFETKKVTAALEERLKNSQQELEATYNKLLQQLQARDNRGKPKRRGRSSVKVTHAVVLAQRQPMAFTSSNHRRCNEGVSFQNELIIQIMTESHEIDGLKRKTEDAKMKLVTETKVKDFQ